MWNQRPLCLYSREELRERPRLRKRKLWLCLPDLPYVLVEQP